MTTLLERSIEYLKGVGPKKADLLKKELSIFTFQDLLMHFPYRYVDKTKFHKIRELAPDSGDVQLRGILRRISAMGEGAKKRLVGRFRDETGVIELVWFRGVYYLENSLTVGAEYVVFGRVNSFGNRLNIPHPEMEEVTPENTVSAQTFAPVYPSTEKLNTKGLDAKGRRKIMQVLFEKITPADLPENLPEYLIKKFHFSSRYKALKDIHFPKSQRDLDNATNRLKFEELFFKF